MKISELKQIIKEVLNEFSSSRKMGVWWDDLKTFVRIVDGKLVYDNTPLSKEEAMSIMKWFKDTIPFAKVEIRIIK